MNNKPQSISHKTAREALCQAINKKRRKRSSGKNIANIFFAFVLVLAFGELVWAKNYEQNTNLNNAVKKDNVKNLSNQFAKNLLKEKDLDGDHKLSVMELNTKPYIQKNFAKYDSNKDGFLSSNELNNYYERTLNVLNRRVEQPKPAKATAANVTLETQLARNLIKRKDLNSDLRLSRTELTTRPSIAKKFNRLDHDGDSFLSEEELANYYGDLYKKANALSAQSLLHE